MKLNTKSILKKIKLNESTISTVLGIIVVLMVGSMVVNHFRGLKEARINDVAETSIQTGHLVAEGETLWSISESYYGTGYEWDKIAEANDITTPQQLEKGQRLVIPTEETVSADTKAEPKPDTYTVQKGDHLWGIAVEVYGDGYKWIDIAKANDLTNPDIIHTGNVLILP